MPFRLLTLLIVSALLAGVVHREAGRGTTAPVESRYLSWLAGNSQKSPEPSNITFLPLGGNEGPMDFAILLDKLAAAPPVLTAVVPTLNWLDADDTSLDILRDKASRLPNLILGETVVDNSLSSEEAIPRYTDPLESPVAVDGATTSFTAIDLGIAPVLSADGDAVLVPLVARAPDGTLRPSLPLSVILASSGISGRTVDMDPHRIVIPGLAPIPVDRSGRLRVPLATRGSYPTVPADTLYLDDLTLAGDGDAAALAALPERIALLGADGTDARRLPVPGQEKLSLASIFAMAIATIQTGNYLRELPQNWQFALWGGIVLVGAFLLRFPRRRAVALGLLALVLYLGTALITFQSTLVWWPFAVPGALLVAIIALAVILPAPPTPPTPPDR